MNNADFYPAGSYKDTNAPYNEHDVPEQKFTVVCSQTLSKSATVLTSNYIPGESGVDYEADDEGHPYAVPWQDPDDTSDTNWAEEWHENDHYTPKQLIELFAECLTTMQRNGYVFKTPAQDAHLIEECANWTEDEVEFIEE